MSAFMDTMYRYYGSHERPAVLWDHVAAGELADPDEIAEAVPAVWSDAHLPAQNLSVSAWLTLFNFAGYTEGGKKSKRPAKPITLYRCAEPRFVHRLAWTASLEVAERFAVINKARYGDRPRYLYTITAPPERLLAHITDRDEDEYVADTRRMRATRLSTPKVLSGA